MDASRYEMDASSYEADAGFTEKCVYACYKAILNEAIACSDEVEQNHMVNGFLQIAKKICFSNRDKAIQAISDRIIEMWEEEAAALLPVLRKTIDDALADAAGRYAEAEREAEEKYGAA